MDRSAKRLNALQVKAIDKPGMHHDGQGLYLQVTKSGSKSWIYRYTRNGKARTMGLGGYPLIGLAKARERHEEARNMLSDDRDPIEAKHVERASNRLQTCTQMSFQKAAEKCIAIKEHEWSSAKHATNWKRSLEKYAYPILGERPVSEISTDDVRSVLDLIWLAKPETADRVRGRIETVLTWATVQGYRSGENPARWKGHLDHSYPRRSKVAPVKHFPSLPYREVGIFMEELRQRSEMSPLALEFTILTAARSGEVRGAQWEEFDLAEGVWRIPAERMKARREHRVPLSSSALALLDRLQAIKTCNLVFPNPSGDVLSTNAFLALLRRMGRGDITAHGFRATFKTWATEQTAYGHAVVEACLAHTQQGLEAAYQRSDLLERRRLLMEDWATYCANLIRTEHEKIVKIGRIRA